MSEIVTYQSKLWQLPRDIIEVCHGSNYVIVVPADSEVIAEWLPAKFLYQGRPWVYYYGATGTMLIDTCTLFRMITKIGILYQIINMYITSTVRVDHDHDIQVESPS